ncbi:MAG: glutamate-1-semialdehyde 2,1-aminomutase [Spirochaetaceae bacterium]|nr:glutamate-1-semialdehyde 2,1-aminomutase [Spirochaetaceae bacterium]
MLIKSGELYKKSKQVIPGGVNSPVRSFNSVSMDPVYISRGKGSKITDIDGNEYIDYVGSWGPLILGHSDDRIIAALTETAARGTSFGANTEIEVKFAELITSVYPSIEKIRMVNSGTEATMSAVRLARGYTGKNKIIRFEGCYHGHGDSFLIKAGSGLLTLGIPGSPGVTPETASNTLIGEYNNIKSVEELINAHNGEIAALIVEPVMANAGLILPEDNFLTQLRTLTEKKNILLIFDEVITGFRVSHGGAQGFYNITPDITTLGKIIGGGLPVGAFGGKKEIMDYLAPTGPVYQAGTLSGNPLAMAAGYETILILKDKSIYDQLRERTKKLTDGIKKNLLELGIEHSLNSIESIMGLFFTNNRVVDFKSAMDSDADMFVRYFKNMLKNGIYLAPSPFEVGFVSAAHSDEDIEKTIEVNYKSLKAALEEADQ